MAQSNAAHEPSMEEILASIRRIIETTDGSEDESIEDSAEMSRPVAEATEDSVLNRVRESVASSQNNAPGPADRLPDSRKTEAASQTPLRGAINPTTLRRPVTAAAPEVKPEPDTKEPQSVSLAEVAARANANSDRAEQEQTRTAGRLQSESDARGTVSDGDHRAAPVSTKPAAPMRLATEDTRSPALVSSETGNRISASFDHLNKAVSSGPPRSFDEIAEEMLKPMLQEWLEDNLPMLVERLVREEIERLARGN